MPLVNEAELATLVVADERHATEAVADAVVERLLLHAAEQLSVEECWEMAEWRGLPGQAFRERSRLLEILARLGFAIPDTSASHCILLRELAERVVAGQLEVRDASYHLQHHEMELGVFGPFQQLLSQEGDARDRSPAGRDDFWAEATPLAKERCRQLLAGHFPFLLPGA